MNFVEKQMKQVNSGTSGSWGFVNCVNKLPWVALLLSYGITATGAAGSSQSSARKIFPAHYKERRLAGQ